MPLEMLAKGALSTVKARAKRFACGVFDGLSQNAAWLHSNSIFKIAVGKKSAYLAYKHRPVEERRQARRVCLLILSTSSQHGWAASSSFEKN